MTISDLPMDLLTEIVSRVPLRSMRAVRLTCKNWDTLSKSESFRKMHMCNEAAREQGESRMVALMDNKLHLISVFVDDVDHPYAESKGCLNLDDSDQQEQVKIVQVFHCEGLLLCALEDTYRLVVWNPYLCQTRWIEPPPGYSCRREVSYMYGLGYDHNKKSHKILRFLDNYLLEPRDQYLRYEIYEFDSDLWRTLVVSTPHWRITDCKIGVPLKGNTYWPASHKDSDGDHLICFDFTRERFGPLLPLPLLEEEDREVNVELSCLKEEKLTVLLQLEKPLEFEIWVTTTIDPNNVSWTKFLKVDTGPAYDFCGISVASAGLFIDEEKKIAMGFPKGSDDTRYSLHIIGDAGFFRQVDIPHVERPVRDPYDYALMCSCYVPSLVQINQEAFKSL